MSHTIQHLTDDQFEAEVLRSDVPVLVDFWAPWCGPCVALGPVLEAIATSRGDRVKVVKINVDEHSLTAARMGIRSIPTVMLFDGGELIEMTVGARSQAYLEAMIDRRLSTAA